MRGDSRFLNLLKSTRVKRILPILILILIPAAKLNKLEPEIFLLGLNIILIYAASSIFNAHQDNDYELPSYFPIIMLALIATVIIISLSSKIILISSILWILLGLLYNTSARYVVLGDAMVLGASHFALPIATASILLNLQFESTLILTCATYFLGISIMPNTNLKDIESDTKRNYKTLVNNTKSPEIIASAFLLFSILIFAIIYIFLCQNLICLISLIPTAIIGIIISNFMVNKKYKRAMNLMRVYLISAYIFLIINLAPDYKILITAFAISYIYLATLLIEQINTRK